ncbi:pectin lyase-like protein, partial [Clavulina sp. PMI_390]
TTGGKGGPTTTVTTLDALTSAVTGDTAAIVVISGTITGNTVVKIGSNKTVVGKAGASLVGVGLRVLNVNNVIIRNLKISKVLASTGGDAIGVQAAYNVWIDHNDLSSDMDHDKDYYDGLLDITHGCYGVTYSYNVLHDHWKTSLIGHSDNNEAEDLALRVTIHHNYWYNLNSRLPSFRFGQGHIYNNYYLNSADGINTRDGAELLIQNNVFQNVSKAIYATDTGYATVSGNDLGGSTDTATAGTAPTIPYSYTLDSISGLPAAVVAAAGPNLGF